MTLSIYIVDDELPAVNVLITHTQRSPGLLLLGSSTDPVRAQYEIEQLKPDLTFLDADMPELTGLELAGLINSKTKIVFTTAYREYAVEAFEKDASDYLLKPIAYERFLKCTQKIKEQMLMINHRDKEPAFLLVKTGVKGKLQQIVIGNIIYIESAQNYIDIHCHGDKTTTYLSISDIAGQLPAEKFFRLHRSYIVNLSFIKFIEQGQVKLVDNTVIPIGRSYKDEFYKHIGAFMPDAARD